jgi:PEP-CTERM motif-containing protein
MLRSAARWVLVGGVFGLVAWNAAARAAVSDVATDFSLANNPNGVWTYGYMSSGQSTYTPQQFILNSSSTGFVAYDQVGNSGGIGQGWTTTVLGAQFPFTGVLNVPAKPSDVAPYPSLADFPSATGDNPAYPHGVIGGHSPNCSFCTGWYGVKYTATSAGPVDFDVKAWQTGIYPTSPQNPPFGGATRQVQVAIQKLSGGTYSDVLKAPLVTRHGVTNLTGTPQYTALAAPTPGVPSSFAQPDELAAAMRSSVHPNLYRVTNLQLNAGDSVILSFVPYMGDNFAGFLGFGMNVRSGADRSPTKRWDLSDDWSAVGSTATNIGPDGAWSYGILKSGSFTPYDTTVPGINPETTPPAVPRINSGWGSTTTGWFVGSAVNVATGPIFPGMIKDSAGFNSLTGGLAAGNFTQPPTGDWGGGKVMLHTPDATVDAAETSMIRWTAPRAMTVNSTGGLWRGTLPDTMDRRHHYVLMKNGTAIASGTVNELNFNCGAGGTNSACPANFAANGVSVLAGDHLDLQISPLSIPGATPGDYNGDGIVDAADYTTWRDHLGQTFALQNRDPSNSGAINQQDYTFWKNNFGATGAGGGLATPSFIGVDFTVVDTAPGSAAAVPEPGTMLLLLVGAGLAWTARNKCRSSRCHNV